MTPEKADRQTRPKARDLMSSQVVTVPLDCTLQVLCQILKDHGISGAPVVDDSGRVVGVVSRTDLSEYKFRRQRGPSPEGPDVERPIQGSAIPPAMLQESSQDGRVEDIYSPYTFTASPETAIEDIARIMDQRQVHRLLIVSGSSLVGIVTSTDILNYEASHAPDEVSSPQSTE